MLIANKKNLGFMPALATGLWEDVFPAFHDRETSPKTSVPVDILENDENYFLTAEVPGFSNENIKIELNKNILTISGKRELETATTNDKRVLHQELSYGEFTRSFRLSDAVEVENIQAKLKEGVLSLVLPKTKAASRTEIPITLE